MNYFALNPMKKAIYFSNSYLSCCSRRHFEDEKMIRVQGPGTFSLDRQLDPGLNKKVSPCFLVSQSRVITAIRGFLFHLLETTH